MSSSRKILLVFAIAYLAIVAWISVDFARKTTFPGSKPQLKERLEKRFAGPDSTKRDSILLKEN
jgi:hypothetical protein